MTSWSQLIENIQRLLYAYGEDLTNSCGLSSSQPTALCMSQQTITAGVNIDSLPVQPLSWQQNYHDANMCETVKLMCSHWKSSSILTVPASEDVPTPVQKMPSLLQPLKSNPYCQPQKKYRYVNKKFVVFKDSRKDERDTQLVDKEQCKQYNENDPFEFVAESRDQYRCAGQMTLFEETSMNELSNMQQSVTARRRCRQQQQTCDEKVLKQLAEDIASAQSYSLVISQKCLTQLQDDKQTTEMIPSADIAESATNSHGITTSEIVSAVGTDASEIHHNDSAVVMETNVDTVCMPDSQLADCDFVNNEFIVENEWKKAERGGIMLRAVSGIDVNVETEQQLNSLRGSGSDMCIATGSTTALDTSPLRNNGDRCDSECQVARMPVAANAVGSSNSNSGQSHAVVSTSSDVTVSQCVVVASADTEHSTSQSKTVTVANLSLQKTSQSDVCDIHVPEVAVNSEHNSSVSVCGCDKIIVRTSHKRRHKAQRKKFKNERICCGNSGIHKMRSKAASLIDSDVGDNSSG